MRLLKSFFAIAALAVMATTASASTVYEAQSFAGNNNHSLYLNGAKYHFENNGVFTDHGNTATLTGKVSNNGNGFDVSLFFTLYNPVPASIKPKKELHNSNYVENGGTIDTATWKLWDLGETQPTKSTLTGFGSLAGFDYNVISKPINGPYTYQSGFGANGKNLNFGLSGWLFLEASSTLAMQGQNSCGQGTTCDFNIDLIETPLPASALLLIGGIAGLGAMRKRKAAA